MKQYAARLARNQLVQNAAALYGVQMVRKVLPLVIVPYLAHVLGPSGWGVFAFTQSLAEFVVVVIEFGFNLSATREIARNRTSKTACGEIMAGVLGSQMVLALSGVAGALLLSRMVPILRDNPKLLAAGLFYAVAQGFVPLWFYQGLERMRLAATLEISGRLVGLLSIFWLVRSSDDTWVALMIQAVAPAFCTAIGLAMAYRDIPCQLPTPSLVMDALTRGWRMFVFRSGESLYVVGNAFILGLFASPVQVGYFATAEKLSRASFGLLNPIREVLYPRLSSMMHRSPQAAAKLARTGIKVMVVAGLALSVALFVFAPLLVRLLMGQAFLPAVAVLRVLAILPALMSVTQSAGMQWLLPLGKDGVVNRIILQAGALNVALALWLAPRFAQNGMAWGVVCAELFVSISMVHAVLRSQAEMRRAAEPETLPEWAEIGEITP